MEREIKFRCWHEGYAPQGRGDKGVNPQMIYDQRIGDCLVFYAQKQPVTLMQYTGIPDKNNTPIYELDYVEDEEHIYLVEWNTNQGCWWLHTVESKTGEDNFIYMISSKNLGNGYLKRRDLSVCGNFYENHIKEKY